jgi:hypothetical protein
MKKKKKKKMKMIMKMKKKKRKRMRRSKKTTSVLRVTSLSSTQLIKLSAHISK